MAHLWILLSAGLLLMSVAEPLSSPEENENQALKHTGTEFTESQASGFREASVQFVCLMASDYN